MFSHLRSFAFICGPLLFFLFACPLLSQDVGRNLFEGRCSGCHGADGNGGELGPAIARRAAARSDADLIKTISEGIPSRGMPANKLAQPEMIALVRFIRTLRGRGFGMMQPQRTKVQTTAGKTLDGLILNQGFNDLQLRTDDQPIHLLRRIPESPQFREVTSDVDWPSYDGELRGNRYSKLDQINSSTVRRLALRWIFPLPNTSPLEVTPVVANGVMYVTSINECYALDAGTGRQIWHFQRPKTESLTGNATAGINRGVAIAGDRVFMVTDNAHLLALSPATGEILWETEMADWHINYNATSAPLAVNNLVISGTAGGEQGVRGFVAAFDQKTGKEAWRFWTVPARGEPGSETWKGKGIDHGGAVTWFTGTFDPELNTLYWPTGNPGEDYNGDERGGDNLYSDCILALDAATGKLKWHYQTTPHDLWDWDATETPVVIDTQWHGQPRKLLIQANRNGFFYVLDRTDGKLLLAKPFVKKLTWAKGVGADGRPIQLPNMEPTAQGTNVCPSQDGATNWFSPSFNPATGLFYVQTLEKCSVYYKRPEEWVAGHSFLGGAMRSPRDEKPEKILRALDIQTGEPKWQLPEIGYGFSWGGTLTTAGGLVIFGEDSGALVAADAKTGKPLWNFQTAALWKASPMTYSFDGHQHIAIAAGSDILAFALQQ
jgi:alcohol dehydrogenase (cytochrome c)